MQKDFNFVMPTEIEKGKNGEWRIKGLASTEHLDLQGEIIKMNGLDITPLKDGRGVFNWDHKPGPENVLGVIDAAEITTDGLFIEGYLLKNCEKAKAVYNILDSLKAGDRKRIGLSVEGKVLKRSDMNGKIISGAKIDKVALTLDPVNPNTYSELVKSLTDSNREEIIKGENEEVKEIHEIINEIDTAIEALINLEDEQKEAGQETVNKSDTKSQKYVKKTGTKDKAKYWYKLDNGHYVSSDKDNGPPRVDHDIDHDKIDELKVTNKKAIADITNWDGNSVEDLKTKIENLRSSTEGENAKPEEMGVDLKNLAHDHLDPKRKKQFTVIKDYPVWAMDVNGNCLVGENDLEIKAIDEVIDSLKDFGKEDKEAPKDKEEKPEAKEDKAEKSLAGGDGSTAPSARTGGEALQTESMNSKKKKKKLDKAQQEELKSLILEKIKEYLG